MTTDDGSGKDAMARAIAASVSAPVPSRAEMERERLARKRALQVDGGGGEPRAKRPTLRFATGESILTEVPLEEYRGGNGIAFDDLIDAPRLKRAFLTTYIIDEEWLREKLASVPDVCIALHWQAADGDRAGVRRRDQWRILHPPKPAFSCMHAKLMLLSYDGFLRVVISSGNLVPVDYGGYEKNIVFVQDFPLRPSSSNANNAFYNDLRSFIVALNAPSDVVSEFDRYEFAGAKARIVASRPGTHARTDPDYGLRALSRAVKAIGATAPDVSQRLLKLECSTSSLGALTTHWMHDFYKFASGLSPTTPSAKGAVNPPPIAVVFPTADTVASSIQQGGSLFFTRAKYQSPSFPRGILRDSISSRCPHSLMHAKVILARRDSDEGPVGWIYHGSHNVSSAAWGHLLSSGSFKVTNWELGVVVPMERPAASGTRLDGVPVQEDVDSVWKRTLPRYASIIPFVSPAPLYGGKMPFLRS
ncbi:PLD phosphodiesterase domain-containing protein [Plasmodiophora brassicae]